MSFYGLSANYHPLMRRVQPSYWLAKDYGEKACEISLKGLDLPENLEVVCQRISLFLQVDAFISSREEPRILLEWQEHFLPPPRK